MEPEEADRALLAELARDGRAGYAALAAATGWHEATVAGRALAEHPEVSFAAATTGPSNLLASVLCPDVYALYDFLADRIGLLPGIRAVETAPIIRTVKRAGAVDRPAPAG